MITSDFEYCNAVKSLDDLIAKGTELGDMELLSPDSKNEFIRLSSEIRAWEKEKYPFPLKINPLITEIQNKMDVKHLHQKEMAAILKIDEPRMSAIMRGKRHISMSVAKLLRDEFGISADLILTFA